MENTIRQIILFMVPFIFSLSIHEAAHAWMANKFGDSTARLLGRMTLNPIPHIDMFGTIVFPILSIVFPQSIFFGWGKPVPVNPLNLKDVRRDHLWISLAGPASNLILAIISAFLFRFIIFYFPDTLLSVNGGFFIKPIFTILNTMISLNVALAFFNLVPIPPLDGSKILAGILPIKYSQYIYKLEEFGFFLLLIFLVTGIYRILAIPIIYMIALLKY